MIQVRKLSGRSPEYMETNNEPYEPLDFYNPSIEDMLANPQVVVRKLTPIYGSEDDLPDNFSDDPQNIDPSDYCNDPDPYSSRSPKGSKDLRTAGGQPAAAAEPVPATTPEPNDEEPAPAGSEE